MKLYYSLTSPYARKVNIAAQVLGLDNEIEKILVDVFNNTNVYSRVNPLVKIPALETREGQILVNSPFICEYLNSLSAKVKVIPNNSEKWKILNNQAIADGIMEASVLRRLENLRPPDKFDPASDLRQKEKIENSLQYFEINLSDLNTQTHLSTISVLCALGYLEFRSKHENWLSRFPRLGEWYKNHETWEPFLLTSPPV